MFKWKRRLFPQIRWLNDVRLSQKDVDDLGEVVTEVVGESTKARVARGLIIAFIAAYASSPDEGHAAQFPAATVREWK